MMGDPYDECDTSMILEPTPLSEIVHQQHVLNQQQQQQQQRIQEQHLYLDENSDDFVFRSSKRRRGQPLRVSFYSEAMVHSSPRRIDEIPSMWYSVCLKQ
jgi:RNase adaptor protein for sRNA GlmZ degradation